jgi:glycosyltransferase involved in cell wall biosynthesis
MLTNWPLVSVVIVTKNEEKNIENCLRSLRLQSYPRPKIEIIVVDNCSSDRTKKIAHKYTQNVFNKGPERSVQRNFGLMKAKGKYLMYLDADMILSSTVIEKAVKKMENLNLAGLYLSEIILGKSYWSKVRRFERSFYDGTAIDCVRIIRKSVFSRSGGFDFSLTGPEDWDLDKKIRNIGLVDTLGKYDFGRIHKKLSRINYQKNLVEQLIKLAMEPLILHNETDFKIQKYLSKKNYYSKSFQKYIEKWGKTDEDIQKQFGLFYRFFTVFLENGKIRRLVSYPHLAVGLFLLRFCVGIIFLFRK